MASGLVASLPHSLHVGLEALDSRRAYVNVQAHGFDCLPLVSVKVTSIGPDLYVLFIVRANRER